MARIQIANNYSTSLVQSIDTNDTQLIVNSTTNIPNIDVTGDFFYLTLVNISGEIEIVKAIAVDTNNNTIDVIRGQEGTGPFNFPVDSRLGNRFTSATHLAYLESYHVRVNETPTRTSDTTFTVPGDYTSTFQENRAVRVIDSGGVEYDFYVVSSVYTTETSVEVNDTLPATVDVVEVGLDVNWLPRQSNATNADYATNAGNADFATDAGNAATADLATDASNLLADHNTISGRSDADAHPQSAITGLDTTIADLMFGGQLLQSTDSSGTGEFMPGYGNDLNNVLRPGYWAYLGSNANTPTSRPGLVWVIHDNTVGRLAQLAIETNGAEVWTRYSLTDGVSWEAWERIGPQPNASTTTIGVTRFGTTSESQAGISTGVATTPNGVAETIKYNQVSTRSGTGTWNITGLTIGRPVILGMDGNGATVNTGFQFRVISGSNIGRNGSGRYCNIGHDSNPRFSATSVLIPTATTISLDINSINAGICRAYH